MKRSDTRLRGDPPSPLPPPRLLLLLLTRSSFSCRFATMYARGQRFGAAAGRPDNTEGSEQQLGGRIQVPHHRSQYHELRQRGEYETPTILLQIEL